MFIDSIQVKNTDKDLYEKLEYLFDHNTQFNVIDTFTLASCEPQTLSCSIYQNYLSLNNLSTDKQTNIKLLENYSNIMDCISDSNIIHNCIYENQNWDLYNNYIFSSTVSPSYYLKKNVEILSDEKFPGDVNVNVKNKLEYIKNNFVPYKDISYNFLNSYEEVKRICKSNLHSKIVNNSDDKKRPYVIFNAEDCFTVVNILVKSIDDLNKYFTKNKKGKNTTKKEKLDLCDNITSDPAKKSLDLLVNNVYEYNLFEINIDDFLINKSKYKTDEDIKKDVQKVDLRVLKRFLNIFTMDDKHKTFKSHIETSIQYKILQRLVENCKPQTDKISNHINNILTEDLDKIWNLT
jgi:hypothetical protein